LIREKMVDIGQYVGTGTQLLRTFAVDYAEVRLPLTDRDIAFLDLPQPGQPVKADAKHKTVTLSASVGGRPLQWNAHIVRTDGVIDSSTRVYHAVAQVPDPYGLRQTAVKPALQIG